MYIKTIEIRDFRHLKNITFGPFSVRKNKSELIVLAGPNGSGKTSILESIQMVIAALAPNVSSIQNYVPDKRNAKLLFSFTDFEKQYVKNLLEENKQTNRFENLSAYSEVINNIQNGGDFNYEYHADGRDLSNISEFNELTNQFLTKYFLEMNQKPYCFYIRADRKFPQVRLSKERIIQYSNISNKSRVFEIALNDFEKQYQDTVDYLSQQFYHYYHQLGKYYSNNPFHKQPPPNPIDSYNEILDSLFPGYQFVEEEGVDIPTRLMIKLPSGINIDFWQLSSGEKEIFFIISFILRFDINNSIILIDEPELHLHPELARRFVRTLLNIKPSNQIWIATHNSEIIDEAGKDKTIFIGLDHNTRNIIVESGINESTHRKYLKELMGYSGYIGVSKNMVFLEGIDSSSDRKLFSSLFNRANDIKFIPSKSTNELDRINTIALSLFQEEEAWLNYYIIRDRDFLNKDSIKKYQESTGGRMYILKRYHIENYLIDYEIISIVLNELSNNKISPITIRKELYSIAISMSGEVLRDMLEFRLNIIYQPQDFSLGNFMNNVSVIDSNGNEDTTKINVFKSHLQNKINTINLNLFNITDNASLDSLIQTCLVEITNSLNDGNDSWRILFPGRKLLEKYSKKKGINPIAFTNTLIRELALHPDRIPLELKKIIDIINKGEEFEGKWYD